MSITKFETPAGRVERIKQLELDKYFKSIEIVSSDKDSAYERTLKKLGIPDSEIVYVDDRVIRGRVAEQQF